MGLQLRGYTLLEQLEQGENTLLYRGYREQDRAGVLVRVSAEEFPSAEQLARLRHAYAISCEHPLEGVLSPLSLEAQGHGLALIWDDPGGATLRRVMQATRLEPALALRIAASLARTLGALHARGVVHNDLRPEHLIVDVEGARTWLLGFGRASRLSELRASTQLSAARERLLYISPELSGRMNRRVDRRSDLYSLGVLLYELLCGAPPFASEDPVELVYGHLVQAPAPVRELRPELPAALEQLCAHLLAKNAEDRYQHAGALAEDLEACAAALEADAPARVELHPRERGEQLDLPQRLYGREAELEVLSRAWRRVSEGGCELLLVRGYSGVGKSVLVHELLRELTGARGYFISGKFDQLGRAVPYAPLLVALGELVHALLTEPEAELARVRTRLLRALESSAGGAGVLTELLPALERVIGPQPPPPALGPSASRQRLSHALQRLIGACCGGGRPLVLFLDDLQWAELASLELLAALLEGGAGGQLLVIGAYRSNEVDEDHPLSVTLRGLEGRARVGAIELGPLARGDVARFMCDTLALELDQVAPLARVVYDKTEGNPFFLIQLLRAMSEEGLLGYDAEARRYRWDLAGVRALAASDNVVEFMTTRLAALDARVLAALELAACIGHRFTLATLAAVAEARPRALVEQLWPALEEGLLVPLGDELHYLLAANAEQEGAHASALELRFAHDRIQQAAYALIGSERRAALHLRVGRSMAACGRGASEPSFERVAHLNLAHALLDADERLELARLNLRAGERARAATAFELGADYYAAGLRALGEGGLEREHALGWGLHMGRAQVALAQGEQDAAEASIDALVEAARSDALRAEALDLRVMLCAARGRSAAAVEAGVEGLRLLGFEVPADDESRQQAYARELEAVLEQLGGLPVDAPVGVQQEAPARARLAMTLARHTALSAFGVSTRLGYWLSALAAHHSLRHGLCEESAAAYALLGAVVGSTTQRFAEAHRLVSLALAVHEQRGAPIHEASMLVFYFVTVSHYQLHWRALLPYLERARVAGIESGEHMFLGYSCSHWVLARMSLGDPLDEVRVEVERMHALMQRSAQRSAAATQQVTRQLIACLEGRSAGPQSLSDERGDEAELLAELEGGGMSFALHWYRLAKGMLAYLAEDYEGALAQLEPTATMIPVAFTPEARYFTALAILALDEAPAPGSPRAALLERCREQLRAWAQACPDNYGHRHAFVEAEHARRGGELERGMELYDRALELAEGHDWPRDLGLINERAATFYLQRGRERIARAYMSDAAYAYLRWGARAHLGRLSERYPGLVPVEAQLGVVRSQAQQPLGDELDMQAFARSLQLIAREVLVDSVVEQLMQLVLRSAGAERGVLLFEGEGGLRVYASADAGTGGVSFEGEPALERREDLPVGLIRYVARTAEALALDDAGADERFGADPYIARVRPRSLACLAMTQHGRGRGVLYLENNATRGVFTPARLELLELLASQAMISLDNARLFDALREREARWRALMSSAPDLITILDDEHRIEALNKAPAWLEREQVIGARFEELLSEGSRARAEQALREAFASGQEGAFDARVDGPAGPVLLRTRLGPVVRGGTVERVTAISTDVTEQRALAEQLNRSQRLQAVGTLAGGVAHDFNNLLAVIIGAAELGEIFAEDERVRAALNEVIEAAERGGALTHRLLSFGRRHALEPSRVDLGQLVRDSARLFVRALSEGVELHIDEPDGPCFVRIDPGEFERVLINLVVNARDAMPEGGRLSLSVRALPERERVSLEVRDTGVGMDDAQRQRIFDPFFTTKEAGKGTGLGLATVLTVVEASGGTIAVESEPGRGSCFRIELPEA